jgi:autotransporter translocation and assembly factor TamB
LHFTGPQTDIQASGTLGVSPSQSLNVLVNAGNFSGKIISSGNAKLSAAVVGTVSNPQADGRVELQTATLNDTNFSNGLSNANGVIALHGKQATVQMLTAESGGGKITGTNIPGDPRASLARSNLQIDAYLRVRGSASQPAVLGRINLT